MRVRRLRSYCICAVGTLIYLESSNRRYLKIHRIFLSQCILVDKEGFSRRLGLDGVLGRHDVDQKARDQVLRNSVMESLEGK